MKSIVLGIGGVAPNVLAVGKDGHLAAVGVKPLKSLQFVNIVKLPIAAQFLPNVC